MANHTNATPTLLHRHKHTQSDDSKVTDIPPEPISDKQEPTTPESEPTQIPFTPPHPVHRRTWVSTYRTCLLITDLIFMTAVILVSIACRGLAQASISLPGTPLPYAALAPLLILGWLAVFGLAHAYDKKVIGIGLQEYRYVVLATFGFFGAIAIFSYLLKASLSRSFFLIGLPLGLVLLVVSRWICRQILTRMRHKKRWVTPTLIVGHADSVRSVLKRLTTTSWEGYKPTAVLLMGPTNESILASIRETWPDLVFIDREHLDTLLGQGRLGAVIVAGGVPAAQIRALSWRLEDYDIDFLVSPSVVDVAGPRMSVRAADGLSFVHVDLPEFSGWKLVLKRVFDIVFSATFMIVFSWLYLIIALAVKLDDGGPVFFKQTRIGKGQKQFTIHKFRTMQVNAESMIGDLMASQGSQAFFKPKNDPRITKVGSVLRKWSLDELPQFWDVFAGSMSIVGPRPQIDREIAEYAHHHYRRLLVKPGITGPWQISGRNDLSVEDSFRLDLAYVDNWSAITDVLIVLKTLRIVANHQGAS